MRFFPKNFSYNGIIEKTGYIKDELAGLLLVVVLKLYRSVIFSARNLRPQSGCRRR